MVYLSLQAEELQQLHKRRWSHATRSTFQPNQKTHTMRLLNTIRLSYHATACACWRSIYHFAFDQCINSERRHSRVLCSEVRIKPSQLSR